MNRRAQAAMIATATLVAGCARTRASLPPQPSTTLAPAPLPGPVELTPLPQIRTSINQGKIPADTSTVRASYIVGESPEGARTAPAATARVPAADRPTTAPDVEYAPAAITSPESAFPSQAASPTSVSEAPAAQADSPAPSPRPVPAPESETGGPYVPEPSAPAASEPVPSRPVAGAPSGSDSKPAAGAEGAAEAKPVTATPSPLEVPDAKAASTAQAAPLAAGSEPIRLKTDPTIDPGKRSAYTVAMVGGTIITLRELKAAVCHRFEIQPAELQELMHGTREQRDQFAMMARGTIEGMVDNVLLLQEAQVKMKKNWKMFTEFADKSWKEKELPRKLKKYDAEDEFGLRKKMEARGESLDDIKDLYKQETMARDFLMISLQPKVDRPGKPELEAYYAEHRKDHEFHREARVYWREIMIPVATPADLATARKTADSVRARLAKGEDFATLARSTSHGATASKGGVWETSPGGNPVPAINDALATMKPGEVSTPIVGPRGIHVLRVDRRTASGPAPFIEVQKQIAEDLFKKRFSSMVEIYLRKLRDKTTISSPILEQAGPTPAVAHQPAKQDAEAQRTAGP